MYIRDITVDGFGKFSSHTISGLNSGLNLFYGRNEAGKSTLRNFIIRILFGFPDGRSNKNLYEPVSGGKHGGSLRIENNAERMTLLRYSDSKTPELSMPGGKTGSQEELSRLLGYTGGDIFGGIYAFGIEELNDFSLLGSDQVRDRIYSAGTGIGSVSIADIQKEFDKIQGELYKKGGKNPVLNTLFRELRETDSALKEAGMETETFDRLNSEFDEISTRIETLELEFREIDLRHIHYSALEKALPEWILLQEVLSELDQLPEVNFYPEGGLEKLQQYLEKQTELQNRREETENRRITASARKDTIKIDHALIEKGTAIRELLKGEEKYRTAVSELPRIRQKLDTLEHSLRQTLSEIGPGWNSQRLSSMDMSIPVKEKIRSSSSKIKDIRDRKTEAVRTLGSLDRELERIESEKKKTEERLKSGTGEIPDEKLISERRLSTVFLRNELPVLRERERTQELLSAMTGSNPTFSVPPWAFYVLIAAALAALAVSGKTGNTVYGVLLVGTAGAAVLIAMIMNRRKFRRLTGVDSKPRAEAVSTREDILKHAQTAGFDSIPDMQLLSECEEELRELSSGLSRLKELGEEKDNIEKEHKTAAGKLSDLESEEQAAQAEWKAWLAQQHLQEDLSPGTVLEIFSTLRTSLEQRRNADELRDRVNEMNEFTQTYENRVTVLTEENPTQRGNAAERLSALLGELEKQEAALRDFEECEKEIAESEAQLEYITEQEQRLTEQVTRLFKAGMAKDEQSFRKNGAVHRQRLDLEEAVKKHTDTIRIHAGSQEAFSSFAAELESETHEHLKVELKTLSTQLEELRTKLIALREKKGALKNEIETVSKREEISRLRFRKSELMEEAAVAARKWSVISAAEHILKHAVKRYEKERQPDVIRESCRFLETMTLGRYPHLYSELGESSIYIEDRNGKRREIDQLSTGTRQQLYLAVRFGLIRELNKRSAILPAVFDDIMVNFDCERMEAASRAVHELAESNQVLYFTCHERTVETFRKIDADINIITMQD